MALQLKTNLLIDILSNSITENKYSKSLLNLKAVYKIEKSEQNEHDKANEIIDEAYNKIISKENNFLNNVPLNIIEKNYSLRKDNLNNYIYIDYKGNEINIKVSELFSLLENYFQEMFILASLMANFYNLEIKINNQDNNEYF